MCLPKPESKGLHFLFGWMHARLLLPGPLFPAFFCVAILSIHFLLLSPYALAQTPDRFFSDDPEKPWHIVADKVKYDQNTDLYIAEGNVVITKADRRLAADFVQFDHKTMKALAVGNVILTSGEDMLSGRQVEMDLTKETGTIYDGTIFLKENHFYISGDKIQKTGKFTYTADKASISTCDGDQPAWKITGRDLNVTIEGYGTVKHASLWAKKIPVLYAPFFVFPVKLKRQSGLLPPQIGVSERKGFEYIQPYYWAISENSDATFFFHHMQERGEKIGGEYRYILKDLSKGAAMADFLDDRKIDDGTLDSSQKWGYEDDPYSRPNSDRYWFRMKHDQKLPFNFSAKVDLDVVSDQDYLTEFENGYTGFDDTNEYFFDTFGRGLDDYNDPTRINRLNLNRIWPSFSLNAETRWNDNVIYRRQQQTTAPLQELPFIGFDALKQPILEGPFFYELNSSYTYFYREEGTKGHRGDVYPRFSLPYKFKNYFALEPSFGLRGTGWYTHDAENPSQEIDTTEYRGIYDLRIDSSTDVYRTFALNSKYADRLKHTLRPQIVYEYIPHIDQNDYPSFDSIDRILEKNLITYSLTNIFTSRSEKEKDRTKKNQRSPITGDSDFIYHQFSRLKLQQSYDINKADDDPQPFSPILAEFDLVLGRYFSLRTDASWSTYETDFVSHNVAANFSDTRGDRLFVEHRYTQGQSETFYTDFLLNITSYLSAYADYEQNIFDGKKIRSRLGLIYKAQCWSLNVRYTDQESDRKFEFMIALHGLGEIGTSIAGRTLETPFD